MPTDSYLLVLIFLCVSVSLWLTWFSSSLLEHPTTEASSHSIVRCAEPNFVT